jgi:endonuclease YncB( thermonuclease family)
MNKLLFTAAFVCAHPSAVDGDTLRCAGFGLVRLIGIDAPEMPGHCRPGRVCTPGDERESKAALARRVKAGPVTCDARGRDRYGRMLARCAAGGADLSCAQIKTGAAVRRYGWISCRRGAR